jgi:hypothetical protein
MTTKLTLSVDERVVAKAKRYAKRKKISLSGIVTKALEELVANEEDLEREQEKYSPVVRSLMGIISLPDDFDLKEERYHYLLKKHG